MTVPGTTPEKPPHVDDLNDAAWAGIEADMAVGRCWACGRDRSNREPHKPGCPEAAHG